MSVLLFFSLYLAGAELGHRLSAEPGHFATLWPNAGLFLAFLLRAPARRWWVIAAAAANLTSDVLVRGQPPVAAFGFALANTVEAVVAAAVIRRLLGPHARLDDLRSVLTVFAVTLVSTLIGGMVGAATVSAAFGAAFVPACQVW